ncbi:MAG: rhomboid family intramembrane serine protease [Planctomycetota bacterium]
MGIYDREYYREHDRNPLGFGSGSVVKWLILINVGVWVVQVIFPEITSYLACTAKGLFQAFPHFWTPLTASFAHSHDEPWHVAFNMLALFVFGRELEESCGKRSFLTMYLAAGVVSMIAQAGVHQLQGTHLAVWIVGASGSVFGVIALFGLRFPQRTMYLFFLFPVKMWAVCATVIGFTAIAALFSLRGGGEVAHFAHLGGAAVGYAYFQWKYGRGFRRDRARVFTRVDTSVDTQRVVREARATPVPPPEPSPSLDPQVVAVSERIDELLQKISEQGIESLTASEREYLDTNSKHYRNR